MAFYSFDNILYLIACDLYTSFYSLTRLHKLTSSVLRNHGSQPPSTFRTIPVEYDDASLSRKSTD